MSNGSTYIYCFYLPLTSCFILFPHLPFDTFHLTCCSSIPDYFIWIRYISWFYYGNEALIINQWADVGEITCEDGLETLCRNNGTEVINALSFDEVRKLREEEPRKYDLLGSN